VWVTRQDMLAHRPVEAEHSRGNGRI
jgi:hypothetical protein